jgi:uncharacterized Zn finger protein (UPF0148 family)
VLEISGEVTCPYCGHVQSEADLAAELEAYGKAVDDRLGAADAEYARAAGLEQWASRTDPGRHMAILMGLMVGAPLVLAGLGLLVHRLGLVGETPGFTMAVMGVSYAGLVAYLVWYGFAKGKQIEARKAAPGQTEVACPNCGAPGVLTAGQALDACAYCGASLIPSESVIARGLDAAQQAARAARMARYRAEREGLVKIATFNQSPYAKSMHLMLAASLPVMLGVVVVGYSFQMATGRIDFSPGIFVLWAMAIAVVGPAAWFVRGWMGRRGAWRSALEALGRQFGGTGRLHAKVADWVPWLDAYWPGEYEVSALRSYGPALSLKAGGYPALIVADLPDAPLAQRKAKMDLLLAAAVPGHDDEGSGRKVPLDEGGKAAKRRLLDAGFQVTPSGAGVLATAGEAVIDRIYRHPAAAHALAPLLSDLSALAASMGAVPAAAVGEDAARQGP